MRRNLFLLVSVVAAAGLVAAGCGSSGPKSVPADGVAVVGKQTITKSQYSNLLDQARHTYKAQKRPFPKQGSQQFKSLQDQAVQYLVQQSEFEQKAKDLNIEVTDKQISDRLKQVKQQYFGGDEKRYKSQLAQQGLTDADVRDQIRVQLLSEAIFKKVTESTKVSDQEVQAYYDQHKSQYETPESRDIRHILVNSKPLADKLYAQLKGGASFAKLAKRYSKDPGSAAKGGSLGSVSRGQTVAPFDKTAFSLKTGELSKPVKSQYGWHIIQALSAVRPAKSTPISQVKDSIRAQLLQQKKNKVMTDWINSTKKDFCAGKLAYQEGYKPLTDPCAALTATTGSTATATTTQ